MKLDYNTMQPGQEFWATHCGFAMHCEFIEFINGMSVKVMDIENKMTKNISYIPELGFFIPFNNELEALKEKVRIEKELHAIEIAKLNERIAELEAENARN